MIKKQAYIAPNIKIHAEELEALICQSVQVQYDGGFTTPEANVEDHSGEDDWGW